MPTATSLTAASGGQAREGAVCAAIDVQRSRLTARRTPPIANGMGDPPVWRGIFVGDDAYIVLRADVSIRPCILKLADGCGMIDLRK